jgi:hypothetical protein
MLQNCGMPALTSAVPGPGARPSPRTIPGNQPAPEGPSLGKAPPDRAGLCRTPLFSSSGHIRPIPLMRLILPIIFQFKSEIFDSSALSHPAILT